MSLTQKNYNTSTRNLEKVVEIQLSLWNPDEILKGSVCEVYVQDPYENSVPREHGLFDSRMGVIEKGKKCMTCHGDNNRCTGHFGHIVLAKPVYYYHFISTILKVLKCVCWRCSKCLINLEDHLDQNEKETRVRAKIQNTKGKSRFLLVTELCKSIKECKKEHGGCGVAQPSKYIQTISKEGGFFRIRAEFDSKAEGGKPRLDVSVERVYAILRRITDADVDLMGLSSKYSRPDWMICRYLPVPPPHVRPSVRQDGNRQSEDDLTQKLTDIIKTNKLLSDKLKQLNSPDAPTGPDALSQITVHHDLLQYHVATLIDNEIPGVPPAVQRGSGRPLKSLKQRLSAKEGRVRGNLMGKRCNFTARSVITPDTNISLDELGVPMEIAMRLTFPVIVTDWNREELTRYVQNGPNVYPGAITYVQAASGDTFSLKHIKKSNELRNGDIVNRHLIDGDVVLFNRQPSLHRMSMMGHRVRVLPKGMTFRLNVSVAAPYNADFDGDEMNTHLSQSLLTLAELKYLAAVPLQIVSPQANSPVMGLIQDAMLAANRLTNDDTRIKRRHMCQLMMWNDNFNGRLLPKDETGQWSGQQIYSTVLPETMNMEIRDDDDDTKIKFEINNGALKKGALNGKSAGKSKGGLIHVMWKDYSPEECRDFVYDTQKLANNYLLQTGFSVGIADCMIGRELETQSQEVLENMLQKYYTMAQMGLDGTYVTQSNKPVVDDFETEVYYLVGQMRNEVSKIIIPGTPATNRLKTMLTSGAKGKEDNLAQIYGCLGLQEVEGGRTPLNLVLRSFPFFTKDDFSPKARGFVASNFMRGLDPQELFAHAVASRIGVADSPIKTAESGYVQRKLIKSMEDYVVRGDLTVRDAANNIIQFQYGEDSYDAARLEENRIDIHTISNDEFNRRYCFPQTLDPVYWRSYITNAAHQSMNEEDIASIQMEYSTLVQRRKEVQRLHDILDGKMFAPLHVKRTIQTVSRQYVIDRIGLTDLTPTKCIRLVQGAYKRLVDAVTPTIANTARAREHQHLYRERTRSMLFALETLMMTHLNSKVVITEHRLTEVALEVVLGSIYKHFIRAIVNPGEMVGVIASQFIGEPLTQMTLNTFHNIGSSASKSKMTSGVPRVKEIINVSKNPKMSNLTIYLKPEWATSQDRTNRVASHIRECVMQNILRDARLFYEKESLDGLETVEDPTDREMLQTFYSFQTQEERAACMGKSRWVIRLEMNRARMFEYGVTMYDVLECITKPENRLRIGVDSAENQCIYTDDNADSLVFRIHFNDADSATEDERNNIYLTVKARYNMISNLLVKGVPSVMEAHIMDDKETLILNADGSVRTPKKDEMWKITTEGSDLQEVLRRVEVDATRTFTNNINEIYDMFGIEAARQLLIEELQRVFGKNAMNYRHLAILADAITNRGGLLPIDIHGVKKSDIGPLARASFEETVEQLVKSSYLAETDKMSGVSANIMLGQVPPCGTGCVQLLFDERRMYIQSLQTESVDVRDLAMPEETIVEKMTELQMKGEEKQACAPMENYEFGFTPMKRPTVLANIRNM